MRAWWTVLGVVLVLSRAGAAPPANDTCAGAIPLANGVPYSMNTDSATEDAGTCVYRAFHGVWFSFVAPVTGALLIETVTPRFDPDIEVNTGSCGALHEVGCQIGFDTLSNNCVAGQTYYIRVSGDAQYGQAAYTSGDMQITVRAVRPAPSNDEAAGARTLADGVYTGGSTADAFDDAGPAGGPISHGVWFTFTPSVSGTASLDTCPSDFDTRIEVFDGPPDALRSIAHGDDDPACGNRAAATFPCVSGVTYWICAGGSAGATGRLQLYAHASVPTGNDTCAAAALAEDGITYAQGTAGFSNDTTTCAGTIAGGAWFRYVATATGTATVETCGSGFATIVEAFAGACGASTSLGCSATSTACSDRGALSFACRRGQTYLICAGGSAGGTGSLRLRVHARGRHVPLDFDGDGRADLASYDDLTGEWTIDRSNNGHWISNKTVSLNFGFPGTLPVPDDFDGDGREDPAVFDPASGQWYLSCSTAGFRTFQFGYQGAVPVAGDFDGDGNAEVGCYEPARGMWYIRQAGGAVSTYQWGFAGTLPVPDDFDGDGREDIACYDPASGNWYVRRSSDGAAWVPHLDSRTYISLNSVSLAAIPYTGDFDGDGRADIALAQNTNPAPSIFVTRIDSLQSTSGAVTRFAYTSDGYSPPSFVNPYLTTGDFDGDGRTDFQWYGWMLLDFNANRSNYNATAGTLPNLGAPVLVQYAGWPGGATPYMDLASSHRYIGRVGRSKQFTLTTYTTASLQNPDATIGTFTDNHGVSTPVRLGYFITGDYLHFSGGGTPTTGPITLMVRQSSYKAYPTGRLFDNYLPIYRVIVNYTGTYLDAAGPQPVTLTYSYAGIIFAMP